MIDLVNILRPGDWTRGDNMGKWCLLTGLVIVATLTLANILVGVIWGSCGVIHSPTVGLLSTVGGFILRDLGIRTIWQSN